MHTPGNGHVQDVTIEQFAACRVPHRLADEGSYYGENDFLESKRSIFTYLGRNGHIPLSY